MKNMMIKEELPMLMSAHELQSMGMGRSMAYKLLNRADAPVVKIGERKFVLRDKFMLWLESQMPSANGEAVGEPEEDIEPIETAKPKTRTTPKMEKVCKRKQKTWNAEKDEHLIKLIKTGFSCEEIASIMGCEEEAVTNAVATLKQRGVLI